MNKKYSPIKFSIQCFILQAHKFCSLRGGEGGHSVHFGTEHPQLQRPSWSSASTIECEFWGTIQPPPWDAVSVIRDFGHGNSLPVPAVYLIIFWSWCQRSLCPSIDLDINPYLWIHSFCNKLCRCLELSYWLRLFFHYIALT